MKFLKQNLLLGVLFLGIGLTLGLALSKSRTIGGEDRGFSGGQVEASYVNFVGSNSLPTPLNGYNFTIRGGIPAFKGTDGVSHTFTVTP